AARQRRQAKELARPRARTCPSEEAITKAKEVASHRPAVVFGVSYRGEKESDDYASRTAYLPSGSVKMANTPPSPPANRQQLQQEQFFNTTTADGFGPCGAFLEGGGGGSGGAVGGGGGIRDANIESDGGGMSGDEAVLFRDSLCRREMVMLDRNDENPRQRSHQEGGAGDTSSSLLPLPLPLPLQPSALLPQSPRCTSKLPTVGATHGYDGNSSSLPASAMVVVEEDREETLGTVKIAQKGADGGGSCTEQPVAVVHKENELVHSWLLDVRLETETAGTALRVLLKMCKERGRDPDAEQRRLSSFRTALEGMGLFSAQHGPMPTTCDADQGGLLAHRVSAAARQVAMTKAAVKNLLRLMQSVGPGEDGGAELDQYTEFIRQQREIMTGCGDRHGAGNTSPRTKREPAIALAAVGQQSKSVDHHSSGISGQKGQEKVATYVTTSTEGATFSNPKVATGLPSSPVLAATATTIRDPPARANEKLVANDATITRRESDREKGTTSVIVPDGTGFLAVREVDDVPVSRALDVVARASSVVAVDSAAARPPVSDAVVLENPLMQPQGIATWEAKQTELTEPAVKKASSMHSIDYEIHDPAETVGENGSRRATETKPADTPSLVSARESADPDYEEKGKGKGGNKEETDDNGTLLLPSIARSEPRPDVIAPTATPSSLTAGELRNVSAPSGGDGDHTYANEFIVSTAEAAAEGKEGQTVPAAAVVAAVPAGINISARERLLRHLQATTSPRSVSDDDSSCCSVGGDDGTGNDDENDVASQPAKTVLKQGEPVVMPAEDDSHRECDVRPTARTARDNDAVLVAEPESGVAEPKSRAEELESQVDNASFESTTRLAGPWHEEAGTRGGEASAAALSNDGSGAPGTSATTRSTNHLASTQLGSIAMFESDFAVSHAAPEGPTGTLHCDGFDISASNSAKKADKPLENGVENDGGWGKEERVTDAGPTDDIVPQNVEGSVSTGAAAAAVACEETILNVAKTIDIDDQLGGSCGVIETAGQDLANTIDIEEGKKKKGSAEEAAPEVGAVLVRAPEEAHTDTGRRCSATDGSDENDSAKFQEKEKDKKGMAVGGNADGEAGSGGAGDTKHEREEDTTTAVNPTAELEWIEGYDPGHDCYYYHHVPTGESRWFKPDEPYEPYVHSDEENDDLAVTSSIGGERAAGTRTVIEADETPDEDCDRRRDRRQKSIHRGNSDERRHRTKRSGKEEEWEAEATNARSSSSQKDKDYSTGRRRSSQSGPASASSRRHRGNDDRASAKMRSGSGRSSRQRHGKTAIERLNDLTDENACASDDLRSDYSDRGGGRERRRSTGSTRRRSRGSRRHREDDDDAHQPSRKRGVRGGGDDRDEGSRRARTTGHSSSRPKRHYDDEDDAGSHAGRRSSGSRYSKILLSDGSVSSGGEDGGDRKRGASSVRGGSRVESGSRR
ncbi:unnamed protein product, partial [Hapterophycus canaliculatus]